MKRFAELTEQEILALAISNEEEDSRIYRGFAEGLRGQYPASAKVFDEMAEEEVQPSRHAVRSLSLEVRRLPAADPPAGRQGLRPAYRPLWLVRPLGLDEVRKYAEAMEYETARFYRKAAQSARDASVRELLDKLAEAEDEHENLAQKLGRAHPDQDARASRRTRPRGACSCCNTCSRGWPG